MPEVETAPRNTNKWGGVHVEVAIVQEFAVKQVKAYKHRKLACTSELNALALMPNSSNVGDIICILQGFSLPFILRKVPAGGGYFYIGICFFQVDMSEVERKLAASVEEFHLI